MTFDNQQSCNDVPLVRTPDGDRLTVKMGIFSADEIVTNASSSENLIIAGTLILTVLLLLILVCARMYGKYLKKSVCEVARREVTLANMRQV